MDKNFIFRVFDKGLSLLVFVFILKQLNYYDAEIVMIFFGSIFGFIISLNQDLIIKNQLINNKKVGSEILLSILINNTAFVFLVFFLEKSFLSAVLFYFASSGRFDILKYESKFVGAQFQTAISLSVSILLYFIISNFIEKAEIFSLILYMIFKSVIGEIYLSSFLINNKNIVRPKFNNHLALSGLMAVSIGYVLPTICSYFVHDSSKLLYHIAAIQRSLSPAQQIGAIYSRNYDNIYNIVKNIKFFIILSVLSTIIIYSYMMNEYINLYILIFISIISLYSTISGSWTIKMIAQGKESIELLKTTTAISISIILIPFLMAGSIYGTELVISVYVTYLFFLYVPFIHFYK